MFPVVYYQVLTVTAQRAYPVGFKPKHEHCGHHHRTISEACACRRLSFPARRQTHRIIIAHYVEGFGAENRKLYWMDEAAQEFVMVLDDKGRPSPSFTHIPTPDDFQAAADRAFEVVEPEPTIAKLLRRAA